MATKEMRAAIEQLKRERDELSATINLLEASYSTANAKAKTASKSVGKTKAKKKMSPAQRKKISDAMKKRHAEKKSDPGKAGSKSAKKSKSNNVSAKKKT